MLQSIKQLYRETLRASDGDIGRVEDFYFDDTNWAVRYLVVDTSCWHNLGGAEGRDFKGGEFSLMLELARKQDRELGLRFELGLKPEQFAQAAADHDAEADGQIGPSGCFTGEECFGPLYDSVGIGQKTGVLQAILYAVVDRLIDLCPSLFVKSYDLQRRMILTEPALNSVAHVHEVILLLPWHGKIALAKVFEQGLEPAPRPLHTEGLANIC